MHELTYGHELPVGIIVRQFNSWSKARIHGKPIHDAQHQFIIVHSYNRPKGLLFGFLIFLTIRYEYHIILTVILWK